MTVRYRLAGLAALLLLAVVLGACAAAPEPAVETGPSAMADDLVPITYTYGSRGIPADLQKVNDAMNAILNEKIGVQLTLEPIDFGAYNEKMQLRLAAGEQCDIIFTAPWINSYSSNVANGVLHPLDDILPEHAPGLYASMPPSTWEAVRVQGHIYGVINQQIFPKPWGVHPRKDLMDKYGFTLDNVTRYEDMEPWLAQVRDGEGITPVFASDRSGTSLWRSQYYGLDPLDDGIRVIAMRADDENRTVINSFESEGFQAAADLARRWIAEGFFPDEPAPDGDARAMFRAGLFAMGYHVEKPGNDVEAETAYGFEFLSKNLTDPLILDTAGATATMNAICQTSAHPEKAMQVLEEFNTNVELYNLLSRGIEGEHWVWADEANLVIAYPEGVTADTSPYNPNTDWMFGNQFNAYYRDHKQVGAWEATKIMNDTAYPSRALGFVVDRTPIETEIAQVVAVWDEFVKPIEWGWENYADNAAEVSQKLNDAGAQVIIDEVQRQLDAWAVNNSQ